MIKDQDTIALRDRSLRRRLDIVIASSNGAVKQAAIVRWALENAIDRIERQGIAVLFQSPAPASNASTPTPSPAEFHAAKASVEKANRHAHPAADQRSKPSR